MQAGAIDREALLQAAARFDSGSSGSDSHSDYDSESRAARRKLDHKKHSSKKRKDKHSSKKSHKAHKRHKRSDHEKIAELERRAAAKGQGSLLPGMQGRLGFGRHSSITAPTAGDAVILDTSGDANNALYESLYGGDVPRYHRMDPLDLVCVSRRLGRQLPEDADVGNSTADRYYRGRHFLQERSRSAKRIHLADLKRRQKQASSNSAQCAGPGMLLLPPPTPLLPPEKAPVAGAGASTQQQQQQDVGARRLAMPAPVFIPLEAPEELLQQADAGAGDNSWRQQPTTAGRGSGRQYQALAPTELVEQAGLTADELLLQATRAWNVAVRERPQDEELWLEFAAFQHSATAQQQPRARAVSTGMLDPVTAEKQICLLTRGLTHHPSSSQLLLALLRCFAAVAPDADALEAKWAGVLARQGGSWQLWREYIALRQSSFADFKVSSVEKAYGDALHSLQLELLGHRRTAAAAHKQQHKQLVELSQQQLQQLTPLAAAVAAASGSSSSTGLKLPLTLGEEALELQLVQLLLGLLYVELEAGLCEQALAKIQALLEFHLFPPQLPPGGVPALLRLFATYWRVGVPCIGESGARGWAYWCCWHAMGMEQPAAAAAAATEEEAAYAQQQQLQQEPAGWGGWFEVPQQQQQQQQQSHAAQHVLTGQQQPADGAAAARAPAAAGVGTLNQPQQGLDGVAAPESENEGPAPAEGGGDSGDSEQQHEGEEEEEEEGEAVLGDDEASDEELDETELMRQLGVQLEQQLQEVERQGLPPDVLARWVHEEASCSARQWAPLHSSRTSPSGASASSQPQAGHADHDDDGAGPPDPARIAGLDCVEPCLFLLRSAAALKRLVLGCVELLGVRLGCVPWCSSNCPTPLQQQALNSPGAPLGAADTTRAASSSSSRAGGWSDAAADEAVGSAATGASAQQQQQQWQQVQQEPWYVASDERWQWAVKLLQRLVAGGPCSSWPELCQAVVLLQASKPSEAAAATGPAGQAACHHQQQQQGGASSGCGDSHSDVLQQFTVDGAAVAAVAAAAAAAGGAVPVGAQISWPSQQQLSSGRAAAKQLLADQQDNLLLYDAYGCLEAAAGQAKTARKVLETALTLATATGAAAGGQGSAGEHDPQEKAAAADAAALLALHLAQLELTAGAKAGLAKAHIALHALLAGQHLQAAAAAEAAGCSKSQQGGGLLADARLRDARLSFQQRIPQLIASAGGFLTPAAASTIAAAALFELTVGLRKGEAAAGLDAGVAVCKQVTAAVPEAIRTTSAQHEQLAVLQCHMLVAAATGNSKGLTPGPGLSSSSGGGGSRATTGSGDAALSAALAAAVPPARARQALAAALQLYPHSWGLLQLQVALDHACYTLAGLRQQLTALTEMNPSPGLWAAVLQAEALRPGGRVRLGALFERALAAPTALMWHQQERLQRQRQQQAWVAAFDEQQPRGRQQGAGDAAEQRRDVLLLPVSAAGSAAALLDVAVWDGYRGWGYCSSLWEQYIRYELGLGRLDAARKLFLRAVHAVPGAKRLWLSGFGAVCAGLQPRECSALLNVMQEREVLVRKDVYEVLLAAVAEKQQMQF